MTTNYPAIIFVPGIRAKPQAIEQQAQLRRCLNYSLGELGVADAEKLAEQLEVVGWSYSFYGVNADISPDLPGIEALLAGAGDPETDIADARSVKRRLTAAMYAIGDQFPLLSSLFATSRMEARLQEINRYFDNRNGEGMQARDFVKRALQQAWQQNRHVLLMGHSFGSVIAYDALWELSHSEAGGQRGRVDLFVSMGSPLTMRYVRRRLKGAGQQGRLRYPANIDRWLNLAAVGEVTALDRRMSHCFRTMRDLNLVQSIDDNLEVVNRFRGPDGLNVHKCYGYLASPAVAAVVRDFAAQA